MFSLPDLKRNLQDGVEDGGGAETRPKNVYVYFLVAAH